MSSVYKREMHVKIALNDDTVIAKLSIEYWDEYDLNAAITAIRRA